MSKKRDVDFFVFDIYVAIVKIEIVWNEYNSIDDLLHDFKAWDSIVREFEIIGEAANILIKNSLLDEEHRVVVDFRNLVIHEYFGIDPEEVEDIIVNELNDFKKTIVSLIESIHPKKKERLIQSFSQDNKYYPRIVRKIEVLK